MQTVLVPAKTTALRRATIADRTAFQAYEIHLGVTTQPPDLPPFARLDDGTPEGIWANRVIGTYLHGALEDAGVCSHLFGIDVANTSSKDSQYAALADWFERYAEDPGQWLTSLSGSLRV